MIECFLVCVPPTANHQNKKIIRLRTRAGREFLKLGDRPEKREAEVMIDTMLMPHRPLVPLTGPLSLTLEFTWPWRQSDSLKVRARGRVPMTTRPDASNMAITTENRLKALRFMVDDAVVAQLVVRKFRGDHPGIGVRIEPCLDPVQTVVPPMAVSVPREAGLLL